MPTGCGRGSEWLRWDPHLHAPGTALNDQFGGDWDGYFDRIEAADPAVAALGITDYMGVDCYEEFRRRRGGRAPGVRLVFPNIEFRLTPFTSDDKAINAHLLVSPEHPQHVQEIRNALANLTFNHDAEIFRCDDEGLTRLGLHDDPRPTGQAAYRRGLELFKPPFESFRKWWEGSAWLK